MFKDEVRLTQPHVTIVDDQADVNQDSAATRACYESGD